MNESSSDYERMAWHLMTHQGMTAEDAVETIRLLLSDDPVDTAVLESGIGSLLDGLLNDGCDIPNCDHRRSNRGYDMRQIDGEVS